ncbi:hypothetical protein M9H77_19491 [Catharanthus roseus]|uniref:Uncharacterized protein n=1 Tax=Catharanthus roseus TaxID=4058 RepID=A0ACC0BAR9_CATRO|nr:hypothetical protein M9H77_19491 [Catharanthus roseus]
MSLLEGPPLSPTQFSSFTRKVQTIICRYMIYICGTLSCTPLSMIFNRHFQCSHRVVVPRSLYRSMVLMELRGALVDCSVAGFVKDELLPLHIRTDEDMQTLDMEERDVPTFNLGLTPPVQSHPSGSGTLTVPPPSTGGTSYAPPPPGAVGSFHAPSPPGTASSSISHMPISYASSFDLDEHDDERTDDVTPAHQLGFGHHVGMRFVDKIQAISAAQKWSIRMGREYRVAKNKSDQLTIPVSNVIQEVQVLFQTVCTYKKACYGKWREYTLSCSNTLAIFRENGTRPDAYVPYIYIGRNL